MKATSIKSVNPCQMLDCYRQMLWRWLTIPSQKTTKSFNSKFPHYDVQACRHCSLSNRVLQIGLRLSVHDALCCQPKVWSCVTASIQMRIVRELQRTDSSHACSADSIATSFECSSHVLDWTPCSTERNKQTWDWRATASEADLWIELSNNFNRLFDQIAILHKLHTCCRASAFKRFVSWFEWAKPAKTFLNKCIMSKPQERMNKPADEFLRTHCRCCKTSFESWSWAWVNLERPCESKWTQKAQRRSIPLEDRVWWTQFEHQGKRKSALRNAKLKKK